MESPVGEGVVNPHRLASHLTSKTTNSLKLRHKKTGNLTEPGFFIVGRSRGN
jgi:hypothetical protein